MKAIAPFRYPSDNALQALITKAESLISAVRTIAQNAATTASSALSAAQAAQASAQYHGTSSTAAATAAKVVTCEGFVRNTGSRIAVKFTAANTASNPTLNVNGTGAASIYMEGAAATSGCWAANEVCLFEYDGTYWNLIKTSKTTSLSELSGTLPVNQGGTGATDAATARSNLGVTPANIGAATSDHNHSLTSLSGTLSVAKGGTGATDAATARSNLGITPGNIGAATASHSHALTSMSGTLSIAKGGTGATTAAAALAALGGATMNLYTASIPTSGWSGNSTKGYTRTITVSGIKATDVPVVGVQLSSDASAAKNQGAAFACINRITTATNSITCYAYSSAPKTAITIQLLVVRSA